MRKPNSYFSNYKKDTYGPKNESSKNFSTSSKRGNPSQNKNREGDNLKSYDRRDERRSNDYRKHCNKKTSSYFILAEMTWILLGHSVEDSLDHSIDALVHLSKRFKDTHT